MRIQNISIQALEKHHLPSDFSKESLMEAKLIIKKTTISYDEKLKSLRKIEDQKCTIPRYLERDNPIAWITTRLRFGQAWQLYRNKLNYLTSSFCRNDRCKQQLIQETVHHVITECPMHRKVRDKASDALRQLKYQFSDNLILGDISDIKKNHLQQVEHISCNFIQAVIEQRPI